jgi:hypothetical protein
MNITKNDVDNMIRDYMTVMEYGLAQIPKDRLIEIIDLYQKYRETYWKEHDVNIHGVDIIIKCDCNETI